MSPQGTAPLGGPGEVKAKVFVVEDEPEVRKLLRVILSGAGYDVADVPDGESALAVFDRESPDLVVLDIGLPRLGGWAVLAELRATTTVPILVLTGLDSEADRVRGLRSGADDYLGKPFGRHELVARVEALLRRSRRTASEVYDDGLTVIDFARREVAISGHEVETTPLEFELLAALVREPGVVLSPAQLRPLWEDDTSCGASTIKTRVHRLRRKLADAGVSPFPIEAVRGVGYRYRRPVASGRNTGGPPSAVD